MNLTRAARIAALALAATSAPGGVSGQVADAAARAFRSGERRAKGPCGTGPMILDRDLPGREREGWRCMFRGRVWLAGGVLTTWLGWRSVFLVNVPVGVAAGLLGPHLVPRDQPRRGFARELDLPGAALAVAGLVTLAHALAGAPAHGWGSARTLLLLLAAALVLLGWRSPA